MAEWLNKVYAPNVLRDAGVQFRKEGHVQLLDFLSGPALKELGLLNWSEDFVPMKWRFLSATPPAFVRSQEFLDVLSVVLGRMRSAYLSAQRFGKGDYSLLYDSLRPLGGIAFFLDVNSLDESCGGYSSFVDAAGKEVVRVVPRKNSLSLVDARGLRFFTKYVNHHAGNDRVFVGGVLRT
ncbi:hypothetical protein HY489_00715 [Candidatus Woesearchaeota archaeon]|nr:hypothetical protein [Candidatus Woesearchaeota archaeon]